MKGFGTRWDDLASLAQRLETLMGPTITLQTTAPTDGTPFSYGPRADGSPPVIGQRSVSDQHSGDSFRGCLTVAERTKGRSIERRGRSGRGGTVEFERKRELEDRAAAGNSTGEPGARIGHPGGLLGRPGTAPPIGSRRKRIRSEARQPGEIVTPALGSNELPSEVPRPSTNPYPASPEGGPPCGARCR